MNVEKRTIVVKGTGSVKQSPDVFGVSFKVQGHEMGYSDSLVSLNEEVEALRQAVEAAGIEREALKTTSFDINSDTIYNRKTEESKFNGYIARHHMKIEFPRDMEKSNKLLDSIIDKVESAEFNIYFTVSNPEELKERMLAEAVKNARRKAELMTEAAGVKLGKLLNINYSWGEVHFHREFEMHANCMAMESARAMPDFEPEDLESSDNVEVVWEIVD